MSLKNSAGKVLLAAGVAFGMTACDNGPMEKAGRKIDRGVDKASDKVKDATN